MLNQQKAQSTVEYIILVTAVIALAIYFLVAPDSPFRKKLKNTMVTVTDDVKVMGDRYGKAIATTDKERIEDPNMPKIGMKGACLTEKGYQWSPKYGICRKPGNPNDPDN